MKRAIGLGISGHDWTFHADATWRRNCQGVALEMHWVTDLAGIRNEDKSMGGFDVS